MAPTYVVGSRDRYPTATVAPHFSPGLAMTVSSDVAAPSKASLRRAALERRDRFAATLPAGVAEAFAARGAQLAKELGARTVAAYSPIRSEVPALELLGRLDAAGCVTALPSLAERGAPLVFRQWRPGETTRSDWHGIATPLDSAPRVVPDLLFVPLAAFDRRGHRIGYGAGYYDRALAVLRRSRRTTAVGLAFSVQEVARVPDAPHDERLDYVLTEHALIACAES